MNCLQCKSLGFPRGMKNRPSFVRKIVGGAAINQHNSVTISKSDRDEDRDTFPSPNPTTRQDTVLLFLLSRHYLFAALHCATESAMILRLTHKLTENQRGTYESDRSQLQLKRPASLIHSACTESIKWH